MSLTSGARLGPYEILAPLGAGGMGEVYRALDTRLGRDVALKILPAAARRDAERLARFEAEARATSALSHPNILTLFDVGQHEGAPYVVFELLEGQTLAERLEAGALPARKALDLARQVAEGLAAAHERGIVHRDLKPANVFLTRDGRAKLLDFGLAQLAEEQRGLGDDGDVTQGRVLGTVGYMSPEQVSGGNADARSDIFSFGVVLYEMLSGRRAFKGTSAVDTMHAILRSDPPALEPAEALAPAVERILRRCLEKAPEQRFQSARDLAFALDTLSTMSLAPLSGGHGAALEPHARRRLFLIGLGWAAAGATATGLAFSVARRYRPARELALQRVTFRRGTVEEARFSPDGQTVAFGAAWGGAPVEVFLARLDGPESRPLGLPGSDLLSMSRSGELALSLARRRVGTFVASGTLSRVALAGGAPREVLEDVQAADWDPEGRELAVVRSQQGRNRLEYPPGRVRFETTGYVSHPRFSPDGRRLAFAEHPVWGDDGGHVATLDLLSGEARRLSRGWSSVQGLAWHPSGREVWFTATREGASRALRAVDLGGRERHVLRMAGSLTLHDLRADGRVLLGHNQVRREMAVRLPGWPEERDLSWLDYCFPSDLLDDGSLVVFAENGEGGGAGYSVWLRRTDLSPAVRLSEGAAMALAPDGRYALANLRYTSDTPQLLLVPTGTGQPRELPRGGVNTQAASFFPDGQRVLLTAAAPGQPTRLYVQDLVGGLPRPVAPEGTRFPLSTHPVAPDGRRAFARDGDGVLRLFPLEGGGAAEPLPGLERDDEALRFSADGGSVYVYRPGQVPARVERVELATGRREPWLEIHPADLAGVPAITPVQLTADGRGYVYGYRRVLSDLYVVTGLE